MAVSLLSTNVVDLWLVRLQGDDLPGEADLTDERDLRRFRQIRIPQRQRRFAFRRRSLRHVLDQYQAGCEVADGASGKPQVVDGQGIGGAIHFSLSSSASVCAIAVGHSDIGLDVEAVPPRLDMAAIVDHFIPEATDPTTAHVLATVAPFRQFLAVMRWCRLEAYIKLRGETLHRSLFADAERVDAARDSGCHRVAVSDRDHLCVIAQHQPFRVGPVFTLDYSSIVHG